MVEYDPFSGAAMADPSAIYRELRDSSPVHRLERYDAWALSRFEDVWQVLQDRDRFSVVEGPVFDRDRLLVPNPGSPDTTLRRPIPTFASVDPPAHTLLRQAMFPAFTPQACRRLGGEIAELVGRQLDELDGSAGFDLVGGCAGPIALAATLRFLGLPGDDAAVLQRLVSESTRREPGTPGASPSAVAARTELHAYLTRHVALARSAAPGQPGPSSAVIAGLLQVGVPDGAPLSDSEIAVQLATLLVGGSETLPKIIAGGLLQLWRHPDQRADACARPELAAGAFEEMVRLEGVLQFVGRTLLVDAEVAGQPMTAGQRVLLLLQSANHDEREFPDPERFDIHRTPSRQVGFGHGVHFCIGVHAARTVGVAIVQGLLERYPGYDIDLSGATRPPSEFQIGWTRMPLVT